MWVPTVFTEMPSVLAADLSVWPSAIKYTTLRSASVSGLWVEPELPLDHFVRRAPVLPHHPLNPGPAGQTPMWS